MANGEKMWERHLSGATLASCQEAERRRPYLPPHLPAATASLLSIQIPSCHQRLEERPDLLWLNTRESP